MSELDQVKAEARSVIAQAKIRLAELNAQIDANEKQANATAVDKLLVKNKQTGKSKLQAVLSGELSKVKARKELTGLQKTIAGKLRKRK